MARFAAGVGTGRAGRQLGGDPCHLLFQVRAGDDPSDKPPLEGLFGREGLPEQNELAGPSGSDSPSQSG